MDCLLYAKDLIVGATQGKTIKFAMYTSKTGTIVRRGPY